MMAAGSLLHFDFATFHPMRIAAVAHELHDHPLLQLEQLVRLADRLSPQGLVRYHRGDVSNATNFVNAPTEHRVGRPPEEVIREIETANAWFALHNVQRDGVYSELVREVLDSVKPWVEAKDPGMFSYAGWIFVSSPGAVTPFHMDHEHNFILQVRGEKEVHVFDPLARSVLSEECLEAFHRDNSRELVQYREEHEQHAQVFHVKPGQGAYMPTTAAHWVKNGDNVSITVSFTYLSSETTRREALHRANAWLRQRGITPSPVGANPVIDTAKYRSLRALQAGRRVLRAFKPPRPVFA